jgi:ABC-2 type transport system permease protein
MAIIIAFIIISAIDIDIFQKIKPFLFTTYMSSWRLFFDNPLDVSKIIESILILTGHILVFFGVTVYIFHKKDILT